MSTLHSNYPQDIRKQLSDEELKELAIQNMQEGHQQVSTADYPTEIIELPSKGKVYPSSNFLSGGKVELRYMTAKDEDILTSPNLIRAGQAINKLMQSLIVSPIKFTDLVLGDKNAILIACRVLGYGKQYDVDITCPSCEAKSPISIDLTQLPEKFIPDDVVMKSPNEFEFQLPASKKIVTVKILTQGDEKRIGYEMELHNKSSKKDVINRELSTRLKATILSIDGNYDRRFIESYIDGPSFYALDSKALRVFIRNISPDQKFEIQYQCTKCGHEEEALSFALDSNFFWPKS